MSATSRETAGAVRSAHVAYFMPADWARIAQRAAPALERAATDGASLRLLILVPDSEAAVALSRALAELPQADGRRIVAASSQARLQRLLGIGPADVVVGSPETIAAGLAASAIKLDSVRTVVFAAADEMDAESDALAAVLAEVPKDAARILTALAASDAVDALITRYLSKARRVQDDVVADVPAAQVQNVRYLTVTSDPLAVLPSLLDELDAPSAAVLVGSDAAAKATRQVLASVGYTEGPLAQVTRGPVAANTSVVITLGVPTATAWGQAVAAAPAQVVAICAPRDLEALRLLAGEATPRPLGDRASLSRARAVESRRRAELRAELAEGIPAREVLALEPLLRENDGLEIAAAALRLLERTRAEQTEQVRAAEERARSQMREAQKEKEAAERAERGDRFERSDRGDRGPRPGPRGGGERVEGPRGFRGGDRPMGERKPRSTYDREAPPREGKPRISSFSKDRDGKPRSSYSRDDKPRSGGFSRDDKPRSGGFKRDGGPRDGGPRSGGFKRDDKPRGPRPPRGDR
ncbi:hypothetical protein Strain138_000560 [Pseudogemmatithrix spongiicola]|uniref:DEAD/DEAH box helicase n=1 Tax=Pseudogemmatithrix spongiicola TaxID=3062599 RepID=A0AA49JY67_9BACT|nr:hypothetical protein Strain138_000560 [Gemmatimonadaceae bacterium 'strain 138']WKW14229.1 hypothetical protein Strain318_000560 [Gemmatimonadaceae bacterium 'strain 318']